MKSINLMVYNFEAIRGESTPPQHVSFAQKMRENCSAYGHLRIPAQKCNGEINSFKM